MEQFDIFKLCIPEVDTNPKSWICVKSRNIKSVIEKITKLIKISRRQLAEILSENLRYALTPCEKIVYLEKEWVPLLVILELLNILNKKKIPIDNIKNEIVSSIEFFKTNTRGSIPVKLPHHLTIPLCKLAGAHAADGSLTVRVEVRCKNKTLLVDFLKSHYPSKIPKIYFNKGIKTHRGWLVDYNFLHKTKKIDKDIKFSFLYYFKLVDGYKESVEKFSKWFKECFGLNLKIKKHPIENDYLVQVQNKVIGRYFTEVLNFTPGNKTRIVKEPDIIRNAPLKYRKAFALGVMNFDGCIELDGTISLNTLSKDLLFSVLDVILKDPKCPLELKNKISIKNGRLRTLKSLVHNEYTYLSNLFEPYTEKWYKVLEFATGYKGNVSSQSDALRVLNIVFPPRWYKVSFSQIIEIFKFSNIEGFLIIEDLIDQIKEKNNLKKLSYNPIYYRLKLLEKMQIVKSVKYRDITGEKVTGMKKAYLFNSSVKNWKLPYRPWLQPYVKLS